MPAFQVTVRVDPIILEIHASDAREALVRVRASHSATAQYLESAESLTGEDPSAEVLGACEACDKLLLSVDGVHDKYSGDHEGCKTCDACWGGSL